MTDERDCTKSTTKIAVKQQTNPTSDALKAIWRKKVEASQLFLSSELDNILAVWIQFIRNCLQAVSNADAHEFYVEAAELAAEKLKHFPNHGWKCLTMEFPFEAVQCSRESLLAKDISNLSASSTESINDVMGQVDFLLQLVASSLKLVKSALDSSFKPTVIELKSKQVFILPKKYIDFEPEEMQTEKVRKDVLHGVYDEYILPLQIAKSYSIELDDEFWARIENQAAAE